MIAAQGTTAKSNALVKTDLFVRVVLAVARLVLQLLTNHQYGFHRDELATLHDARNRCVNGGQPPGKANDSGIDALRAPSI